MDDSELIPWDSPIVDKQIQYYMNEAYKRQASEVLKVLEQLPPEYKGTKWKVRNMENGRRYFQFLFKDGHTTGVIVNHEGRIIRKI